MEKDFMLKNISYIYCYFQIYVYICPEMQLEMEKIQSVRELVLNTLTNMGIKYEIDEDDEFLTFDYQDMEFDVVEDNDNRHITLRYINLEFSGEIEDLIRRRRIINKVSKTSNVVIYTTSGATFYNRNILFIKEIPEIEDYLRSQLQEVVRAYEMVKEALQKEQEKKKNVDKRDSRDEASAQTKELFIKTISELDCEYEPWTNEDSTLDSILFDYGGEKFRATFYDYYREVVIENHYATYSVELSDLKKVKHLCEAVNKANHENDITTTYTIEHESNKIYAASHCIISFMAEMPKLLSYLRSVLDSFYDVRILIEDEMEKAEEIEKLGDLHQEPNW